MNIGTSWQKIRIGMRFSIYDTGSDATVAPGTFMGLQLGICQGDSYALTDPNIVDFMGFKIPDGSTRTYWSRGSGYAPAIYYSTDYICLLTKTGASWTRSSVTNGNTYLAAAPAILRSLLYLDITKGSPSYTLTLRSPTSASMTDASRYAYLTSLENEAAPVSPAAFSATTLTLDYAGAGLHDSVAIHWGNLIPAIDICDINVLRFY